MKVLTLLAALVCCGPLQAAVVTFHGVQEYMLGANNGTIDYPHTELIVSISYFEFFVSAPGPITTADVSLHGDDTLPDGQLLNIMFGEPCGTGPCLRDVGDFLTNGPTVAGWHTAAVSVHPFNATMYGLNWETIGPAIPMEDYSPVPFTLQISGDNVFKNYGQYVASTVPEPGAVILLLTGLAGLRRRRNVS